MFVPYEQDAATVAGLFWCVKPGLFSLDKKLPIKWWGALRMRPWAVVQEVFSALLAKATKDGIKTRVCTLKEDRLRWVQQ